MIKSELVCGIFADCLFTDGEESESSSAIMVNGIMLNVGFHPERLEGHRNKIEDMLNQLPNQFKAEIGGGWSFLEACNDNKGDLWTGSQQTMEELFMLGMGIGKVKYLFPREVWTILPGGMPYYRII